jgi:hypothetical protein
VRRRWDRPGGLLAVLLHLLDLDHGREHLADVVGQVGVLVDVLQHGRAFATAIPGGELLPALSG